MKTLKGVIAASTGKGVVVPDESDLHMVPWYFILSSHLYSLEISSDTTQSFVEFSGRFQPVLESNITHTSVGIFSGELNPTILYRSLTIPDSNVESRAAFIASGELNPTIIYSTTDLDSNIASDSALIAGGSLYKAIGYLDEELESEIQSKTAYIFSGSLG